MKASGPGLKGGLVGNPAEFTIDTKGAGTGGLGLTVEGPTEAKIECSDNGDGTCSVSYLPTEPGDYLVNILFESVHIPGSPFRADIQMPFDPSKVVASGSGLKRAKVSADMEEDFRCLFVLNSSSFTCRVYVYLFVVLEKYLMKQQIYFNELSQQMDPQLIRPSSRW